MSKKQFFVPGGILLCGAIIITFLANRNGDVMTTTTIQGKNGKPFEAAIAEKTYIDVNGTKLGMFIVGEDETKPVLLFLGGGPGIPEYLLEYLYPSGLEKEFIVCYPEYRGTSLSYKAKPDESTMTKKQFVADAVSVTDYLRKRFNKDKIYLMSHSFGSFIGLNVAKQYPERYYAYIAMSQIADQFTSETEAFDYMKNVYTKQGNNKKVAQFGKFNIRESEKDYVNYGVSLLRDSSMHELGIGTTRTMNSVITGILFPSLQCRSYTFGERLLIWKGKTFAQRTEVGRASRSFNAFSEIPELRLPVYFLAGRYDYTCCYSVQKSYYEAVKAPLKAFYTFEESAHSPVFEEPEKARRILTTDVLNEISILSDK